MINEVFDVVKKFGIKKEKHDNLKKCFCNEIILGLKLPYQCSQFGSIYTPQNPLGPCMVSTAGAIPLCLSVGFIIEEGFSMNMLHFIAESMGDVCKQTGVKIVTGDTKVVERGSADELFINTSGIGLVSDFNNPQNIEHGDEIIITGAIAEHGSAILLDRYDLGIEVELLRVCSPLNNLISTFGKKLEQVKLMNISSKRLLMNILKMHNRLNLSYISNIIKA